MGMVIGIDVGGSTTKIVGIENGRIQSPMFITAADPVTSLFGAFGKYIYDNGIALSDVEQVMLTGVGSAYVDSPLYGLPTNKTDEFLANGLGARHAADNDRLIVVSMGTGTSLVRIDGESICHIGGIGIGGGTLQGLARLLLKTSNIRQVAELAQNGDVTHVNLLIGDICNMALPDLPVNATASLLGKVDRDASEADIACGIIYMVLQTIGQAAILSAINSKIKDFVLIGNLTQLPQCPEVFSKIESLYQVRFHVPPYAEYRTAIGAALAYMQKK
ncbi:type II pantothenate kinase [Mediterranea sp. An20]|uniref:type II pantothenate kinase n=1 Tax=Mediterranea sp. An20 TaxID=1965586 RepID=UPI000B37A6E0|nr:type II pantothenate kinase [Mediterranea sp. An20]OUP08320.1 type II pantothenate kinase [Mediterranea sp. An20]